jgi:L-seryl-tRNA(Ser) seleniumtransferase
VHPYDALGLARIINADGTKTVLGGSLMPPEVVAAMRAAAERYVDLPALERAAGRRIATLIGSPAIEDAAIVCGAAAGLAVATAACVAGTDATRIRALPHLDWSGAKDEVVIQRTHVTGFAQSYVMAGTRLVTIGGPAGATVAEHAAAIGERTAAVTFLGGDLAGNARFPTGASLAEVVALAHQRGVPVIVDAAAELPPPEHLRRFNELGADLVVFSGGKGLCGPQASGFVLGREPLIEACRRNNAPNSAIGRPMKVGKEEICGLLAAVELYVGRDHAADQRRWEAWTRAVLEGAAGLPGVAAERVVARTIPQARLTLDAGRAGIDAPGLAAGLAAGDPSIRVGRAGDAVVINPHNMQEGEAALIVERLQALLGAAQGAVKRPALVP